MNNISKTPLNIAILVRAFPNIVQTYVLNHIISLKNAGLKTLIIAEKDIKQREIHPQVVQHKLMDETLYINTDSKHIFKQLLSTPFTNHQFLSAMIKIIFSDIWKKYGFIYSVKSLLRAKALCRHRIDIIHSHSLFCSYNYLFLKEYFSIPITTTFHGLVPKNVKMLETDKIETVLDISDIFFVNTKFAQQQLLGFGCPQEKIHIVPQGTNLCDFPFKPRSLTNQATINILSVGRLSIEKGFHVAIEALASLIADHPKLKYHIIGGGPEEEHLTTQIQQLGLQQHVEIHGSVSTDELLSHYNMAHIFILPSIDFCDGSHTETQGVVLQEAQSSGIPIIASKTGGIPEIIKDGKTGLLFDEENYTQLSQQIKALIDDASLYQALQTQARKDVEQYYSTKVISKQLLDIYQAIFQNS